MFLMLDGLYYIGDAMPGAVAVPERPGPAYTWDPDAPNGGAWTIGKDALKAAAAAKRYALETGGFTFSGSHVDTDRDTQDRITQANVLAANDQTLTEIAWKASTGFVVTPVAMLHAIGIAVGRFVQACYAAENTIGGLIDAGTIADEVAIEAWGGWPSTVG
jgi:hypothetical protein